MILHAALLIIQTLLVVSYNIPQLRFSRASVIYFTVLPIVDLFVQLLICYICWTVGASPHLQNFDCIIIEDNHGRLLVRYTLKEHVPETMGESYYANRRQSAETESLEE